MHLLDLTECECSFETLRNELVSSAVRSPHVDTIRLNFNQLETIYDHPNLESLFKNKIVRIEDYISIPHPDFKDKLNKIITQLTNFKKIFNVELEVERLNIPFSPFDEYNSELSVILFGETRQTSNPSPGLFREAKTLTFPEAYNYDMETLKRFNTKFKSLISTYIDDMDNIQEILENQDKKAGSL